VLYDSGGGGTVYDPPPKERKDENAGIIIENSEMAEKYVDGYSVHKNPSKRKKA